MALYLARSCPWCRSYFGVVIAEPQDRGKAQPIHGRCANCEYEVNWMLLPGYAQSAVDKILPGPKLDALTAEKVFGWKNVHKHHDRGALYGGTFHSSDVLSFSCVETAFPTRNRGPQLKAESWTVTHSVSS